MRARVAAAVPVIITSLPKPEALIATAKEINAAKALPRRIVVECSTFTIEDKESGGEDPARRRPHHARLPGERHRLAGRRPAIS